MRILHVIHDFLPRHCAGSEIYAYELAKRLGERGHEVHVLCADYDPYRAHASLVWRWLDGLPVTELINNWHFDGFDNSYCDPHINSQLDHVLRAVQPDVLHIHNLLNLSFDLPSMARQRGIPSVATLHEFVLVCPSGGQRVHFSEQHVCENIDLDRCARCFTESHFYSQMVYGRVSRSTGEARILNRLAGFVRRRFPRLFARAGRAAAEHAAARRQISAEQIKRRMEAVQKVYEAVDLFVAPSPALGADFARFGMPEAKIKVSDYGFEPLGEVDHQPGDGRLRIGFVGTLVWHKGAHVVVDAIRQLPENSCSMHFFGNLDTFPDYVAGLRESAQGLPIHFEGGFDRSEVCSVYGRMDVCVVSSLWPENSPLVIHEAFMAGVPVVGSKMGGTADLIDHDINGLLYEATSADSLAAALRRFIDEPDLHQRFVDHLPEVKTLDQDAEEWEAVYREVIAQQRGESPCP